MNKDRNKLIWNAVPKKMITSDKNSNDSSPNQATTCSQEPIKSFVNLCQSSITNEYTFTLGNSDVCNQESENNRNCIPSKEFLITIPYEANDIQSCKENLDCHILRRNSACKRSLQSSFSQNLPSTEDPSTPPRTKVQRLSPSNPTPRTREKLRRAKHLVNKYKCRLFRKNAYKNFNNLSIEQQLKNPSLGLSNHNINFISTQLAMAAVNKYGRRWNEEFKKYALDLYFHSPKAYRMCSKIFFLPSPRSLRNYLSNLPLQAGFSPKFKEMLLNKVKSFKEDAKLCVINMDEIELSKCLYLNKTLDRIDGVEDFGYTRTNKIANKALVFMARGLTVNWKQPLGYFFACNITPVSYLKELLLNCIEFLLSAGLFVKVVVADQGANNVGVFNQLNISIQNPFYIYRNEKIYFIYDTPHLIKSIRNNLQKYDFDLDGNIISWRYIEEFYHLDHKLKYRGAPKLTEKHIKTKNFSKMKVSLAAQVFSNRVASSLFMHVTFGTMSANAVHTADFVDTMDKIFDSLNSHKLKDKNAYLSAITEQSVHKEFLNCSLKMLERLKILSPRKPVCIKGLQITINGILQLWDHLSSYNKIHYLLTRRMNQDALENMFSIVRQKSGCNTNPTIIQFQSAIRHLLLGNLFKISPSSNCKDDLDSYICKISPQVKNILKTNENQCNQMNNSEAVEQIVIREVDISDFNMPSENISYYVAGWFAYKFSNMHACNNCKILGDDISMNDQRQIFMYFAVKNGTDFGKLHLPTLQFFNFIQSCSDVFNDIISTVFFENNVQETLCNILNEKVNRGELQLCHEQIYKKLIQFFIRVQLYWYIKSQNETIKSQEKK